MGVSKNNGKTPEIIHLFIGFSINHPFWVPLFLEFFGNIPDNKHVIVHLSVLHVFHFHDKLNIEE